MRIYIDTSVFGGYFDEEFAKWSKKLFVEFEALERPTETSDATGSVAPDLCVGRSYVGQPPYGMLDLQAFPIGPVDKLMA
jgi:hypothetical protein